LIQIFRDDPNSPEKCPSASETFDYIIFLTLMAKWIKPERYLELEVGNLTCFNSISTIAKESLGVDLNPISL
jgi:hypothetical protein